MLEGNKQYEIAFLAANESGKEVVLKTLNDVKATIVSEGRFSEIRLAYPIKKQMSAGFGSFVFEVSPEKSVEVDKILKLSGEILRFLIVTPVPRKPVATKLRERSTEEVSETKGTEKSVIEEINPIEA